MSMPESQGAFIGINARETIRQCATVVAFLEEVVDERANCVAFSDDAQAGMSYVLAELRRSLMLAEQQDSKHECP
ncbi:MAG: hypothetical protein QM661_09605 [Solimonas sp.]